MNISGPAIEDAFRKAVQRAALAGASPSTLLDVVNEVKDEARHRVEFQRQVRLCRGIGLQKIKDIIEEESRQ